MNTVNKSANNPYSNNYNPNTDRDEDELEFDNSSFVNLRNTYYRNDY
jgi:hypothetical protein